jgi:RHS repeat-associated protein
LQSVSEKLNGGAVQWQQKYIYDRWGNRTISTNVTETFGGINNLGFAVQSATNRLYAPGDLALTETQRRMQYDPAGNLKRDVYTGAGDRTYDAENRMTKAWGGNNQWQEYTYNADGQRVRRKVNGVETWQVYGMDGELRAEYAASGAPTSPQKEYGYRNGQLLITADVTTGPPVPTFSDDFNDNSLDTGKWSVVAPNSPAVVSETGQRLQITLPPNTATYNGIYSNATFDLSGKSVQVEVAQPISQAGWSENFIQVVLDANNYYLISVGSGSLVFRSMTGGVNNQTVIGYDPNAFPYWRIRHDQAANTINLETSSNGTAWTTRKTVTAGFSLTALRFYLSAGAWGTGNGSPGAAKYDNFQLVGNTPSTVVNLQWLVADQLGTPRMIFDKTGALANVKRHDYLPFGEELSAGTGGRTTTQGYSAADGVRQKFTRKERDNETGLDYFEARYFGSAQGRFTSPDPLGGHTEDPQTLNRCAFSKTGSMNLRTKSCSLRGRRLI